MTLKLNEAVEMTAIAMETTDAAVRLIGKATDELPGPEQAATRMLIVEMLIVYACEHIGGQGGQQPRDLAAKLYQQALKMLPEMPVEERPTRVSRTKGPSPWGAVR